MGCRSHFGEVAGCPVCGQRELSQELFRCLNFPAPARASTLNPIQSLEFSRENKSSPGDSFTIHPPRPHGKILRLLQHSPLPALFSSGPPRRCSKPQAGIAASRHRASSSVSLLLLLLSKSFKELLGAVILNHRKGLWERLHQQYRSTTPRERGGAQGIVGIVVFRRGLPIAIELPWEFPQT